MKKRFTEKQGQYLAFIHYYTKVNGRSPAEADMQRYFRVAPSSAPREPQRVPAAPPEDAAGPITDDDVPF